MAKNVPGKVCEGIVYKNSLILAEASLRGLVPRIANQIHCRWLQPTGREAVKLALAPTINQE